TTVALFNPLASPVSVSELFDAAVTLPKASTVILGTCAAVPYGPAATPDGNKLIVPEAVIGPPDKGAVVFIEVTVPVPPTEAAVQAMPFHCNTWPGILPGITPNGKPIVPLP